MVITINGEPAGDRFQKINYAGEMLGTLRIDGLSDKSSIKISIPSRTAESCAPILVLI